jgi:hypothetical protein
MSTTLNSSHTGTTRELTIQDLDAVVGGVGLGMRKSAGNGTSGAMFLAFTFKPVTA